MTAASGAYGIIASGTPSNALSHLSVRARTGVTVDGPGAASLYDSAIQVIHGGGAGQPGGLEVDATNPGAATLTASNVSINAVEPYSRGVSVLTTNASATASATIVDSVMWGVETAIYSGTTQGAANVTTAYDDYPAGGNIAVGAGTITEQGPALSANPGFADPANGDLHIGASSPLVDAGDPAGAPPGSPASDLDGNPRVLDGNRDCAARVDIGAYEYLEQLPATATAPASADVGDPVAFHGTGCSSDPAAGAPVFSWTFDDGGSATGPDVTHTFTTAGSHQAVLTVTDADAHTGTATATVQIWGPFSLPVPITPIITSTSSTSTTSSGSGGSGGSGSSGATTSTTTTTSGSSPPTAATPPVLSGLRVTPSPLHPRSLRRHPVAGGTISYRDTLPATTSLGFAQILPGVRKGTGCVPRPRHPRPGLRSCRRSIPFGTIHHRDRTGANSIAFTGWVGRRRLPVGRYVLFAVARSGRLTGRPVATWFSVR